MLLLILVIVERSAFDLIFDVRNSSDETVRNVFGALRMAIDVLPYTLGPFILGTFLFGLIQLTRTKLKLLPTVYFNLLYFIINLEYYFC